MDIALVIIKVSVTVFVVLGLSLVAERVSPRVAGILSGYPAGIAINLFFFGYEIGPDFAAQSALYTLIGLVATQAFVYFYYRASAGSRAFGIVGAAACAFAGYLVVVWLIRQFPLALLPALFIATCSIFVFRYLFRRVPNHGIDQRVQITPAVLTARACAAAAIVLLITGLAHAVGPAYAGLFAAFPSTLFPIMIILHATYGAPTVHTLVKNFPLGLGSLIIYATLAWATYGGMGIVQGTIVSFAGATIYLIGYAVFDALRFRVKP
jgi:hypothetical protein